MCEYLATTKFTNETRMIFSAPAYDASGKLLGVLFIGKEIDVLERALFKDDDMFGVASSYFICDGEGKVLAATRDMYRNGLISDSTDSIFEKMPALAGMNCENGKCKSVMVNEKKYYASMISLQVNDWMVGCIVDSDVALPEYADNIRIIQRLTIGTFNGFCVGIAYIFLLSRRILAHDQREICTI